MNLRLLLLCELLALFLLSLSHVQATPVHPTVALPPTVHTATAPTIPTSQRGRSKHCSVVAFQTAISCICYLRYIKVAMPFNDSDRTVLQCAPFGPLNQQYKNCRYFEKTNFNVFPTLLWLDSFSAYCFGSTIAPELPKDNKWKQFFEDVHKARKKKASTKLLKK
ncbi:unnamed protein product [Agarophyton chilense]|eukprot:gb/GEZJ01002660.1/.p1 GENE.gb/GEZJ01002660.1/~~gb/GEZJ01002660.1/.p1  ORF type:complete len:188 (-),score=15.84 gb/GEZJ01002660.1/:375-869(-)